MKKLLGMAGLFLLAGFLGYFFLPWTRTAVVQRIYEDREDIEWKYTLFVPPEYKGDRPYRLLVYLHGYGTRGVDGTKPTTDGPGPFIKDVIDVGQSRRMIEALRAAGVNPRYTEYPDEGHGCWGRAYASPELWDWLRRQRLGGPSHDEPISP